MERLDQLLVFLEENPKDSFIQYALALEYLKKLEYDKALQYFEGLVEKDPNYVGTYFHLGKLYKKLNRMDEAKKTYDEGLIVAKRLNDQHSAAELQNARTNLIMGLEDDE